MLIVIILNILVVALAYFAKYRNTRSLLGVAFFIVFLFTSLRLNFGTDYTNYQTIFKRVSQFHNIFSINFDVITTEPLWAIINYISYPIGFFGFIIVLSAFLCYTYYFLIKKYVDPKYYWLAIFIYVFTSDIMWIQFSAIRQALAIAIFIHSIKFLSEKNNPVIYILLNIIGGLIHSSALFMLPFAILSIKRIRESKILGASILALFFGFMYFGNLFISQLNEGTSLLTGDRYLERFNVETNTHTTLLGSIAWGVLLFIVIYYSRFQVRKMRMFFYLASLYYMVYVLSPLIYLADRMGYYFVVFTIIVYPLIVMQEKRVFIRASLIIVFVSFTLYRLKAFFNLDWVINGYSEYSTIFPEIL